MDARILGGLLSGFQGGVEGYANERRYQDERKAKEDDRKFRQRQYQLELASKGFEEDEVGRFKQTARSRRQEALKYYKDSLTEKRQQFHNLGQDVMGTAEGRALHQEILNDAKKLQSLMDQEYSDVPQVQGMIQGDRSSGLISPQQENNVGLIKQTEIGGPEDRNPYGQPVSFKNDQSTGFLPGYVPKEDRKFQKQLDLLNAGISGREAAQKREKDLELANLPKKTQVQELSQQNVKISNINNLLKAGLEQFNDPSKTENEKIAIGEELLKVINSPLGADAIAKEEAERLGGFLKFKTFNILGKGSTFGRDLDLFGKQLQNNVSRIDKVISENNKNIEKVSSGQGLIGTEIKPQKNEKKKPQGLIKEETPKQTQKHQPGDIVIVKTKQKDGTIIEQKMRVGADGDELKPL